MQISSFDKIIDVIKEKVKGSPEPMGREILSFYGKDPYLILISCLLSLQSRDTVTLPISIKLFKKVRTPQQMIAISIEELESLISSINYFKTKAQRLKSASQEILERFDGSVPSTREDLMSIKGVGVKTANLVLADAFDIPVICVDTHVHRLSNKWGLIKTKMAEETERELSRLLPRDHWIDWNYWLVKWGQNICKNKKLPCDTCADIIELVQKNKASI